MAVPSINHKAASSFLLAALPFESKNEFRIIARERKKLDISASDPMLLPTFSLPFTHSKPKCEIMKLHTLDKNFVRTNCGTLIQEIKTGLQDGKTLITILEESDYSDELLEAPTFDSNYINEECKTPFNFSKIVIAKKGDNSILIKSRCGDSLTRNILASFKELGNVSYKYE